MMDTNLALCFCRVTEQAALAAYNWLGRGDKNKADQAAVEAMRSQLNRAYIAAEIVIGEGEMDEAPMLYIGEKLGLGGERIDIAVDPVDGTRITAMGQSGAVSVLAAADQGGLLKAPDMYMEKLVVGPAAKAAIDLSCSIEENVETVATALGKRLNELTLVTLAKPRHQKHIEALQKMGVRVFSVPDGDVAASLLSCVSDSDVDMMYCIGGAPEGVLSAAAIHALGGGMQARLVPFTQVKGASETAYALENTERQRCEMMGVEIDSVLTLPELVKTDQVVFSMTGITKGDLVEGVSATKDNRITETLLISGVSGMRHLIRTHHKQ